MNRKEYEAARRLLRDNGAYAFERLPHNARMIFLSKDIVDPLAEQEWTKQAFIFKDSADWLKARYRLHREFGHTNRWSGA